MYSNRGDDLTKDSLCLERNRNFWADVILDLTLKDLELKSLKDLPMYI